MGAELFFLIAAIVAGLYMAWNIGANDVANSMGTSVGSRSLTIRQAVVAAGIANFAGAVLVGSHVTETVRKGMFDPLSFDPTVLMCGMLAALLAAGVWLQLASYFGLPVSTTHTIVGAVIGFAVVAGGAAGIKWAKVSSIVASWVISPLLSGCLAAAIFTIVRNKIINAQDPIHATRRYTPFLVFVVFFVLGLVILFKGVGKLHLDLELGQALAVSAIIGALAAVFGWVLIGRAQISASDLRRARAAQQVAARAQLAEHIERALDSLRGAQALSSERLAEDFQRLAAELEYVLREVQETIPTRPRTGEKRFRFVERVFASLQVVSACSVAFVHGANDVANAIGPMAAVISVAREGVASLTVAVPLWMLAVGGCGIGLGIAMWGYRVMATVGKKITALTPTRGFSAEFAAAATVALASRLGLPVSTTHTLVGAVLGVGIARGLESLNWRVVRHIISSWLITLPAGAGLAIMFYALLRLIFVH